MEVEGDKERERDGYQAIEQWEVENICICDLLAPELSTRGELTRIESIIAPFSSERVNDGTSNFRAWSIHITSK